MREIYFKPYKKIQTANNQNFDNIQQTAFMNFSVFMRFLQIKNTQTRRFLLKFLSLDKKEAREICIETQKAEPAAKNKPKR